MSNMLKKCEQRQPAHEFRRGRNVARHDGASGGGGRSLVVYGRNGGEHSAERRECGLNRKDCDESGGRRAAKRAGRHGNRAGDAGNCQKCVNYQEIASRRRMLSLNATIEAARAQEGRQRVRRRRRRSPRARGTQPNRRQRNQPFS